MTDDPIVDVLTKINEVVAKNGEVAEYTAQAEAKLLEQEQYWDSKLEQVLAEQVATTSREDARWKALKVAVLDLMAEVHTALEALPKPVVPSPPIPYFKTLYFKRTLLLD